jgi:CRP-like cAMP-binding protein
MDWLKPFMHKRSYRKGDVLFNKGDHADELFYVVSGSCQVRELNLELSPGQIVGELGFLTTDHRRTQTVECIEDVEVLAITYDKVSELYFQNPTFGFYFLRLTSKRLLQNVERLERELEACRQPAPA